MALTAVMMTAVTIVVAVMLDGAVVGAATRVAHAPQLRTASEF